MSCHAQPAWHFSSQRPITVVNAEAAVLIVMRRTTRRPATAASRDTAEAGKEISHDREPLSWRNAPIGSAAVAVKRPRLSLSLAGMVPFGPRPIREHREEARYILDDLPGVLTAEISAEARLPDLPGALATSHLSGCRLLRAMVSPKTSRPAPRRSVLLVSRLGIPPMTLRPLRDLHLGRPHRRDRRFRGRVSGAILARGIVNLCDLPASITSSRR